MDGLAPFELGRPRGLARRRSRTTISAASAWGALLKSPSSRWADDIDRFSSPLAVVTHKPKFQLNRGDKFFCIGSCFARNIEEHLIHSDIPVLSRKVICPANEYAARVNGFVNKITTHSILNEIEWIIERPDITEDLFVKLPGGGWKDLQLASGTRPVELGRAMERRAYLIDQYFSRIRQADVIVLTLGLVEVWRDTRSGRYLNAAPPRRVVRNDPDRYEFEISGVAANINALQQIWKRLNAIRPGIRVVVTVSPVPLGQTFSENDVAVANMYSKSVLRAAAEIFAGAHATVDYFPSYEMVSLSPRSSAYQQDCLHVSDSIVGDVVRYFLRLYMGIEPPHVVFDENPYLTANPDVEAALRRGEYASGYEHWKLHGQNEERALAPATPAEAVLGRGRLMSEVTSSGQRRCVAQPKAVAGAGFEPATSGL